jgi:hypothetical protein
MNISRTPSEVAEAFAKIVEKANPGIVTKTSTKKKFHESTGGGLCHVARGHHDTRQEIGARQTGNGARKGMRRIGTLLCSCGEGYLRGSQLQRSSH